MKLLPDTLIVTGAAGFVGSNVVHDLNLKGYERIVLVDDLTDGHKFKNLLGAAFYGYLDRHEFEERLNQEALSAAHVVAIVHLGACTDTTEWDGQRMMSDNLKSSVAVYDWCQRHGVPLVYASSAAVYGGNARFAEVPENERPLNVYGWSKLVFDNYVRQHAESATAPVVGLRYFNVYGPRETHKGRMASVMFHFAKQLAQDSCVRLFEGSGGFADGAQRRDFVHVADVARATTWFLEHPEVSGIFNIGTGASRAFNDVARLMIAAHGSGQLEYIPFPEDLMAAYQHFTEADLTLLRRAGCDVTFRSIDEGVAQYLEWLGG